MRKFEVLYFNFGQSYTPETIVIDADKFTNTKAADVIFWVGNNKVAQFQASNYVYVLELEREKGEEE